MDAPLFALGDWPTNGHLIADIARRGLYLRPEWPTIDPTWGEGVFWSRWRPDRLIGSDLNPAKSPTGTSVDACNLPHPNGTFKVAVIDGPYKLNGRGDPVIDGRYGVEKSASPDFRHGLIKDMMVEAKRVLEPDGFMLVKCQPQVVSGHVAWQDRMFAEHGETIGLTHIDEFIFPSYRGQPKRSTCMTCEAKIMRRSDGRWGTVSRSVDPTFECRPGVPHEPGDFEQQHAARNYSVLLVFKNGPETDQPSLFDPNGEP